MSNDSPTLRTGEIYPHYPKRKGETKGGHYDYKAYLILRRIYFFIEVLPKKYCTIEILYYLCSR
jgi:hypothetical protein